MLRNINILVVPGDTEIAYEIIDSLKFHKYFQVIPAVHEKGKKYLFKDLIFLPYENDPSFLNSLNEIICNHKIDFIIPANDNIALELSRKSEEIKAKIITQSYEVHKVVRFKNKTYRALEGIIPVPKTYEASELEEVEYPIFIKPKAGQGSIHTFKVNNKKELNMFLLRYNPEDFVFMEYLPYDEFTIDCFAHNGKLKYFLARRREKTFRGISITTSSVDNENLNKTFRNYAEVISEKFKMHGIFFFQMKYDLEWKLKLLEIGARVPGSLSINRGLGVNLIEVSIYQSLGLFKDDDEFFPNKLSDNSLTLFRPLARVLKSDIKFENLYVDFDDTLITPSNEINLDVINLIFRCKSFNKRVCIISKNRNGGLRDVLRRYGIEGLFDQIIILSDNDRKVDYMRPGSLLIDDSFVERREAIKSGMLAYGPENIKIIIDSVR
ncbi:MAG: hypothetical protein PWP31_1882 [Clostridia bacterium]|nr:hypothetical protein [Clostridia bacterium]